MAMRMTGLASGMDTESMVKELVSASSEKVNKIKQKKQDVEWKKEIWSGLNTKIYNFYKTELSAFKTVSGYNAKKAVASDETKVSVSVGANASNGTHSVSVEQTASSAYLTGDNIKIKGNSYTRYNDAGLATKFADMVDAQGANLGLASQKITISAGNGTIPALELELGGSGDNGVESISALNAKLKATSGYENLQASLKDGKLVFTNSSEKTLGDGTKAGEIYTIESAALGMSGEVGYEKGDADSNTMSVGFAAKVKQDFTSADISGSTKLADLGIKVGTTFSVNGKDFVVDDKSTINDFTTAVSKMGVSASFDAAQGRFYVNASKTGAANDFNITSSDASALEALGLGSGSKKVDARDAIIYYNGVKYTGDSNTMTINGMTITAKAKTDTAVNVEVSADTDAAYNNVKKFVKAYNELIDEMNKYYSEKDAGYDALTEDERSKLSDTQIEKWEEKAKQGLLRRDSTLQTLLSDMRTMLNKGVQVTLADGSTKTMSLASIGIVTGDYTENGKLHILGDEDDENYASQENKLRAALEGNDNLVSQIIGGTTDNKGVGTQMYDYLRKSMTRIEGVRSTQTFYNDKTLDSEIDDYDDEIDKWEEKLQNLEDKYYNQFSKMEAAMAKMQSQQSYLSSLFGS
ncbi:flagellar filament capping protein FliD [Wujia sp.]|uniref:flagellar filament capping protein FliD n=1 Tax=Wujia sp. TaxID=2944172 RepID=UPI003F815B6A